MWLLGGSVGLVGGEAANQPHTPLNAMKTPSLREFTQKNILGIMRR